jgi:hypothetical protein
MNDILKLVGIIVFSYLIHMMLNAVGIEMSLYITYLLWFVVLGVFLIVLPGDLPNIIKRDELVDT